MPGGMLHIDASGLNPISGPQSLVRAVARHAFAPLVAVAAVVVVHAVPAGDLLPARCAGLGGARRALEPVPCFWIDGVRGALLVAPHG